MTATCTSPTSSEHTDDAKDAVDAEDGENWSSMKTTFAKTRIREELILGLIKEADIRNSDSIDLSKKELIKIPEPLLPLKSLERLVLEGNEIDELPENFFDCLTNLVWLDLRNNLLQFLPSIYIGRHKNLRHLLLQGNQLRTLPLELGFVKTLNGLNICNNPLDFPPPEVVSQGTQEVLKFLREVLLAKSEERNKLAEQRQIADTMSADVARVASAQSLPSRPEPLYHILSDPILSHETNPTNAIDAVLRSNTPEDLSAECLNSRDDLYNGGDRGDGVSLFSTADQETGDMTEQYVTSPPNRRRRNHSAVLTRHSSAIEAVPSASQYVAFRMAEDKQIAKQTDYNTKESAILQRRKDEEMLKQWREESKLIQQRKSAEVAKKRLDRNSSPFTKPVPFGVDKNHMKILNNEQRIKEDVKQSHERLRDYHSRQAHAKTVEQHKIERIHDLEKKIKSHTREVHARMRNPPVDRHDEVEQARRDLETAEKMRLELILRKRKQHHKATHQAFES